MLFLLRLVLVLTKMTLGNWEARLKSATVSLSWKQFSLQVYACSLYWGLFPGRQKPRARGTVPAWVWIPGFSGRFSFCLHSCCIECSRSLIQWVETPWCILWPAVSDVFSEFLQHFLHSFDRDLYEEMHWVPNFALVQALAEGRTLVSLKPLLRDALRAMFPLKLVVNSRCPQPSQL